MGAYVRRAGAFAGRVSQALRLVWRASPKWAIINALMVSVQGVFPLVSLYVLKRIVDSVTLGTGQPEAVGGLPPVVFWVLVAGGVSLLTAACRALADLAGEAQAQHVVDEVSNAIHEQSVAVDLSYYEDSRYLNTLHLAQSQAPSQPVAIVSTLIQVAQSSIALLGILWLLAAYNRGLTLLVFLVAVPGAFTRVYYARKLHGLQREQAEQERGAAYYHLLLTTLPFAKEVRLFGLGGFLSQRYRNLRKGLRESRLTLSRHRVLRDLLAQTLATVAIFGALAHVALSALRGALTPGELVIYYQGFQSGFTFLRSALAGAAGLYQSSLFLTSYEGFLALRPSLTGGTPLRDGQRSPAAAVRLHGVSYCYPNSTIPAVRDVDMELGGGRVVALVGENGSGKSTIVKLLARLHDPTTGTITVDGCDLREVDPEEWRRRVSIVFQDYACYYFSAGDNIWLGDVSRPFDLAAVQRAAEASGADAVISRLPSGYDNPLGNFFTGGRGLSTGEWQKVAVARALMREREAGLIVLDEPSSALDPLAEAELFRRFRSLTRGRSGVLISHRFSTVRLADFIYVLDRGRVAEQGTHAELLRAGGIYARMYRAQAERFQEPTAVPVEQSERPQTGTTAVTASPSPAQQPDGPGV